MVFNAEAIRIIRKMETMINLESENIEDYKSLLISKMLQLEFDEEESMTISSDKNSDGDTNSNSPYLIHQIVTHHHYKKMIVITKID